MRETNYPLLYQVNTRVWLTELSAKLGRTATLDDLPDSEFERIRKMGFDWLWLLSVWQTGAAGQQSSRENAEWRKEFQETLPNLKEDDIAGSGFAITDYNVHKDLGGNEALARVRERMRKTGLKLLLDFVPNHTALDHVWVESHPEFFIEATESDLATAPQNHTKIKRQSGDMILAHGRDPFFPGWPDTLQLNYANPATQEAMIRELIRIAGQCDGVRCDMAMLVLPDVFERTWGKPSKPFWTEATKQVRRQHPDFCFMAEVYWDMEWTLQQQGFDYTYDKRLYDRLREQTARPVREHLTAALEYQRKMARFLENHDEPRAASAFPAAVHKAAAAVTFLTPGLRFFHQGQFEGKRKRISPHLVRGPEESIDSDLTDFYERLLAVLRMPLLHHGQWQLLECSPAWNENWTSDCFICFAWQDEKEQERLLAVINYSDHQSQCYLRLPFAGISNTEWRLQDQLSQVVYERDGTDMVSGGLFLDLPAWQVHLFSLVPKWLSIQAASPSKST